MTKNRDEGAANRSASAAVQGPIPGRTALTRIRFRSPTGIFYCSHNFTYLSLTMSSPQIPQLFWAKLGSKDYFEGNSILGLTGCLDLETCVVVKIMVPP